MLHIHSGDAVADALRNGAVDGTHIVWTELLMAGPLRPQQGYEGFIRERAGHLSEATGQARTPAQCERFLREQDDRLALWEEHDETVIWVDTCLYDQAILVRLLEWFSQRPEALPRLRLICVGQHPAVLRFHGLGQLEPDQLRDLFPQRRPITSAALEQAVQSWAAMCADDPGEVQELARRRGAPLSSITRALQRWLEQFPSTDAGLSRLQQEALAAFDGQATRSPVEVFSYVSSLEVPAFFGDTYLWKCLNDMAFCKTPLIALERDEALPLWHPEGIQERTLTRTDAGDAVREGQADAIELNGIDRWIGGVHLLGEQDAPWRWNPVAEQLEPR